MNSFATTYRGSQARDELVIWDGSLIVIIKQYKQHVQANRNWHTLKNQATKRKTRTRSIQVVSGPTRAEEGSRQLKMRKGATRMIMRRLRRFKEEEEGGKDGK